MTGPEFTIMNALRILVVGLAAYLAIVTIAGIALRLAGARLLSTALDTITPAIARRAVAAIIGASLAVPGVAGADDRATDAPIVMHRLPDATPPSTSVPPITLTTPATATAQAWVIRPGQHFWSVAEAVMSDAWGRQLTAAELIPYWRALIAANRDRLADRDNPDLLFPGQELVLPATPLNTATAAGPATG